MKNNQYLNPDSIPSEEAKFWVLGLLWDAAATQPKINPAETPKKMLQVLGKPSNDNKTDRNMPNASWDKKFGGTSLPEFFFSSAMG
ncbi:MAG: hypothetical protein QNJ36_03600 [Calothrix sp. MO_167.B42]|nr:hypothetical protein [Calothrix sp. MO_167.B42]